MFIEKYVSYKICCLYERQSYKEGKIHLPSAGLIPEQPQGPELGHAEVKSFIWGSRVAAAPRAW